MRPRACSASARGARARRAARPRARRRPRRSASRARTWSRRAACTPPRRPASAALPRRIRARLRSSSREYCPATSVPQPILLSWAVTAVDLRPGVIRYESALWETTALALHAGGERRARRPVHLGARDRRDRRRRGRARARPCARLLVTHADWDHVCGLSAFPGVPAIMSRGAGERIASGQAAEEVVRLGADEGLSWEGAPRADLRLRSAARRSRWARSRSRRWRCPGHTACGAGYRVRDLDLLAVGRLPLGHRVPVRVRLDGGLPCHARGTVGRARARSGRSTWRRATAAR